MCAVLGLKPTKLSYTPRDIIHQGTQYEFVVVTVTFDLPVYILTSWTPYADPNLPYNLINPEDNHKDGVSAPPSYPIGRCKDGSNSAVTPCMYSIHDVPQFDWSNYLGGNIRQFDFSSTTHVVTSRTIFACSCRVFDV